MRVGADGELRYCQADLVNQKAGQQGHVRRTVNSATSTVLAENALARVGDLQPTNSIEVP